MGGNAFNKKIIGFIFLRLIMFAAIIVSYMYLIEHSNIISTGSLKAVISVFLATGFCLFVAVDVTRFIRALIEQSIKGLAESFDIQSQTFSNLRKIAKGMEHYAVCISELVNILEKQTDMKDKVDSGEIQTTNEIQ